MIPWLWILCGLLVLGALRLRGRFKQFPILPNSAREVDPDHVFLLGDGVLLDEPTRRAASAYASAAGLDLLDLIPGDWQVSQWMGCGELVDPVEYRTEPLHLGCSAGHALLVSRTTLERGGEALMPVIEGGRGDMASFVEAALELRRCAPHSSGLAVAPNLQARQSRGAERAAALRAILGPFGKGLLLAQGSVFFFLVLGLLYGWSFAWPFLGFYHAQVLIALGGLECTRRPLWPWVLFRLPLDVIHWVDTIIQPAPRRGQAEVADLRAEYTRLLQADWKSRFEERREECPLCASSELHLLREHSDFFQHKPGQFRLERCQSCKLVFQNPRLTPEGLDFYYKDFYDGLGAEKLEFIFAFEPKGYAARAEIVMGHLGKRIAPRRWLDVGGGHGHFCLSAAGVWPQTEFEVLDLANSVVDAERRGWVNAGHQGFFPDWVAERKEDAPRDYDVVSMSHYLEHTSDPRAELVAAGDLLEEGGLLMIELPDPDSPLGRWLGWAWLPWFQPQHLHMLPLKRLEHELGLAGFDVLVSQRAEAHQRVDLHYAILVMLNRICPEPNRPWLTPTHGAARVGYGILWLTALPFLGIAKLIDQWVIGPLAGRLGLSNTYRVLARRR